MFGQNSAFFTPTVNTAIALSSTLALGLVITLPAERNERLARQLHTAEQRLKVSPRSY